jgi:hypothetical protein
MEDFQLSVADERLELDAKIQKLSHFIKSDFFSELDVAEQDMMKNQVKFMNQYHNVLILRIGSWGL